MGLPQISFPQNFSFYQLFPSLVSLFVSAVGTKPLRRLLEKQVKAIFAQAPDTAGHVINIAECWQLKSAALVAYVSFFQSWFTISDATRWMLYAGWTLVGLFGLLFIVVPVILAPLGTLHEELFREDTMGRLHNYLAGRHATYAGLYGKVILTTHFLLLAGNTIVQLFPKCPT